MSDEKKSELTESQKRHGGWDEQSLEQYVAERAEAARKTIYGNLGSVDPRTGRARRTLQIERRDNPHDWLRRSPDPHRHFLSSRQWWKKSNAFD